MITKNDTMNTRQQFKKLVIMGCHPGMSYEEALEEELTHGCIVLVNGAYCRILKRVRDFYQVYSSRGNKFFLPSRQELEEGNVEVVGLPITIGRVMQAINNGMWTEDDDPSVCVNWGNGICRIKSVDWWLTREGVELDDDRQPDETIEALLKLLSNE